MTSRSSLKAHLPTTGFSRPDGLVRGRWAPASSWVLVVHRPDSPAAEPQVSPAGKAGCCFHSTELEPNYRCWRTNSGDWRGLDRMFHGREGQTGRILRWCRTYQPSLVARPWSFGGY